MVKSWRISVIVLAAFLFAVFSGFGLPKASAAIIPNDISGNWAYTQISNLLNQGVVSGYPNGTFKPNNPVTRAEFVSMINRAFNFRTTAVIHYSDVKSGDWYYNEISKAALAGYISGYPDGSMKPNKSITREEAAVMMAGVLKLKTTTTGSLTFTDASDISSWAGSAVAAMVQADLLSGYPDNNFNPQNSISRGEAATVVYNSMNYEPVISVTGIILAESQVELAVDDTVTLAATVKPTDATNKKVTWESSKPTVASVSTSGKVTAKKKGTTTITVKTDDGGYIDTCTITVVEAGGDGELTMPDALDLYLEDGNDVKIIYAYLDMDDSEIDEVDIDFDDDIIEVTKSSVEDNYVELTVEGTAEGDDTITVTVTTEDDEEFEAECDVTVYDTYSDDKDDPDFTMPDSITLYLDGNDSKLMWGYLDGYDLDEGDFVITDVTVENTDGDEDIVSADVEEIDDYATLITLNAEEEGDCTVTVTVTNDDDEFEFDIEVEVVEEAGGGGDLDVSDDSLEIDTSEDDTVTVKVYLPDEYDTDDIDGSVTWDSDDSDIADIDDYDEYDDYVKLTVRGDEEGDTSITIYMTIDGDDYEVTIDVSVED